MPALQRRAFLTHAALAGLSARSYARAADRPGTKINVAVMGLGGRGKGLAALFAAQPDAHVAALCDVDERLLAAAAKLVEQQGRPTPRTEKDVRRLLADRAIDALVVAAPNHWHALATASATFLSASAASCAGTERPSVFRATTRPIACWAARIASRSSCRSRCNDREAHGTRPASISFAWMASAVRRCDSGLKCPAISGK
jgi:threonine dehydrogenase-like Zn-dependent dehydrogenase